MVCTLTSHQFGAELNLGPGIIQAHRLLLAFVPPLKIFFTILHISISKLCRQANNLTHKLHYFSYFAINL